MCKDEDSGVDNKDLSCNAERSSWMRCCDDDNKLYLLPRSVTSGARGGWLSFSSSSFLDEGWGWEEGEEEEEEEEGDDGKDDKDGDNPNP